MAVKYIAQDLTQENAAGVYKQTIALGIECNRLTMCLRISGCIFNGQITQRYIVAVHEQRVGAERTPPGAVRHLRVGIVIVGDDRVRRGFAHAKKRDKRLVKRKLFAVNTRCQNDGGGGAVVIGDALDGIRY